MRVILVRHGETDWNEEGVFRGRIDVKLNQSGIQQAKIIGKKLSKVQVDAIYSSPLSRALKTAKIIASFHNLSVQVLNEFMDIDFGRWQGLTRGEVKKRYSDIYLTWQRHPQDVTIPGGESLNEVKERVIHGLNEILSRYPKETIVVVSHGAVNKVLLCAVLGLDNSHFWKVKQDNGAINIFEYIKYGSKVFLFNDTCHLKSIQDVLESMRFRVSPLGVSGPLLSASAYFAKNPPQQFPDDEAKRMVDEFIEGKRER